MERKNLIKLLRSSLTARLSLWVIVFVTTIFIAALSLTFSETKETVKNEALSKATLDLENIVLQIDNTLHQVEVGANNMLKVIERDLDKPDKMFDYSRQILKSNPQLTGTSISFEPFYYPEKGRYFSCYSYNNGDSIQTEQEGTDNYQYHCMDWYLIPKLLNKPYWIEPFMENSEEGIIVNDIFTSFSQPIHDKRGNIVGTFSVDICLNWFSETISKTKPYPNSYNILLGKGGTFLVHPDSTKLFYETIFTQTLETPDSAVTALGEAMLAGESGHKIMNIGGESCYVFYKPFKNTGWSVAVVCPEMDIYASLRSFVIIMQLIAAIGILLLLYFCWAIVRISLKPLRNLVHSASMFAEGRFDSEVPDSTRHDEIGQLQRSFRTMQKALNDHVEEVRQETERLEQSNVELLEAYKQTKEDERVKSAILENMTDKMEKPVANISAIAHTICEEHQSLSNDYMSSMVAKMQTDAAKVTELLDDLIRSAVNVKNDQRPNNHE